MADKPTVTTDKVDPKSAATTDGAASAHNKLLESSGMVPPVAKDNGAATVKPTEVNQTKEVAEVKDAPVIPTEVNLTKVTSAAEFDDKVQQAMKASKDGTPVHFDVDNNTKMTDDKGNPVQSAQTEMLYDSMAKADPSKAFRFNKYADEVQAPVIDATKDVHASTREAPIVLGKDITMPDGTKIPEGSKLSVGTVYDGQSIHQIDPTAKIWATTKDGQMIKVADPGESRPLTNDDIGFQKNKDGTDKLTDDGKKILADGAAAPAGSRLTMRTLEGNDPVTGKPNIDPDGKPLVDGNTIKASAFGSSYEEGKKPGYWAPKSKVVDHYKLPDNVSVDANTEYGPQHASGADKDYYMKGGFADAKVATAKNYAGFTDPKSAAEIIQARKDIGLTGTMPAEIGLQTHNEVSAKSFNSDMQRSRFNNLADQIAAEKDPDAKAKIIEDAKKSALLTQEDIAERRGHDQFTRDQLTTPEVNLAVKAAEAGVRAEAPARVATAERPPVAETEKAPVAQEKAPAGEKVFTPGKSFQSSEPAADRAHKANALYAAMEVPLNERTPEQKRQVDDFKEKHGLKSEEEVKGFRERVAGHLTEGAGVVGAIAIALAAIGSAEAKSRDPNKDKVTISKN